MRALLLTLALTAGCSSSDEEAAKGSGDSAADSADTAVSPYDPDPPVTLGPTDRPVEVILPENSSILEIATSAGSFNTLAAALEAGERPVGTLRRVARAARRSAGRS